MALQNARSNPALIKTAIGFFCNENNLKSKEKIMKFQRVKVLWDHNNDLITNRVSLYKDPQYTNR